LKYSNKQITVIFKALCDENRISILKLLQNGECCACELLEKMQLSQPTLSHHMKILCDSGIVIGKKQGKWMHYSISPSGTQLAKECFDELTKINENSIDNQGCV